MCRKIKILDTTLRDGEQSPGFSMDIHEKVDFALHLEKLRVDIIEAGFAISSPGDLASIKSISETIKDCAVCSLSRAEEKDIDASWEALKNAVSPRIHIFIATSQIHMRHKLKMSEEQVLERISRAVAYGKKLCGDIQFSAEDACRSDLAFLTRAVNAAIRAGATTVNIPDTVGYITPTEMYSIIKHLCENAEGAEKVEFAVHCHNDLGLAAANSLGGVAAGASQIECTINGIGERAGNTALEEVVMALATRRDYYKAETRIDTRQIYRTSRQLQAICGIPIPPNKAIVGQNTFAHESGIHQHGVMADPGTYEIMSPESVGIPQNKMVLGKHSGRHAFEERLKYLGYELDNNKIEAAFLRFKDFADKKKVIHDKDIEALIGIEQVKHPGRYALDSFLITSGNKIDSSSIIKLMSGDQTVREVALGDGPIDASFKAINMILKEEFNLESYTINAITEGEDALGEAVVRLEKNGKTVAGRGLSTDIIEASIKAYVNGINKYYSGE